jgi:hypothetical protein
MNNGSVDSGGFLKAVEALAALMDDGAAIFLEELNLPEQASEGSPWESDRKVWQEMFGSNDVAGWVTETTSIYLGEVANLLRAHADVMRTGRVFVVQDLITRSIIERVGHVNWILDHRVGSRERGARAGLEVAASFYTYRAGLSLLEGSDEARAKLRSEAKSQRKKLEEWFDVVRPHEVAEDEKSPLVGDVTRWTVDGEAFPTLTSTAELALEGGGIVGQAAKGTYAAFSGFSHPNVIFSREHRSIDADGRVTFTYDRSSVEKAVRFGLFAYADALNHWVQYFGCDAERVMDRLNEISAAVERASVKR